MDVREVIKEHKRVDFLEVPGSFLMGTLLKYAEVMRVVAGKPEIRIVSLAKVSIFDQSDLNLLDAFYRGCLKDKISLILLAYNPSLSMPFNSK